MTLTAHANCLVSPGGARFAWDRFITNTGICHGGGSLCDCLGAPPKAEDGMTAQSPKQFVVDCVRGVCKTRVMF